MGIIYQAYDPVIDRKVAIKVLAPALLLMGEGSLGYSEHRAKNLDPTEGDAHTFTTGTG